MYANDDRDKKDADRYEYENKMNEMTRNQEARHWIKGEDTCSDRIFQQNDKSRGLFGRV